MTAWHQSRMACYDLETTSPDPETARIVTSCIALVSGRQPTETFATMADPGVEIPEGATAVHGITTEHARERGRPVGEVVQELAESLWSYWGASMPVVAFNASYDFTVLDRECRRHLGYGFEIRGPVIDPYVIDRQVDKYRKGKRTLGAMVQHYGVRLDDAHNSAEDALAAARVAWKLAALYLDIGSQFTADLHQLQVEWHAERQADFRDYLIRSGKPADDVSLDWPLRPYVELAEAGAA